MKISAIHACAPPLTVTNADLSSLVDTSDEWIVSRTGISERHISTGENTSESAVRVAQGLLEKSGISAEEIGLIIVATVSADYRTPSAACMVQAGIGAVNAFAFDINAACAGFVYALSIASRFVGAYKNVMVIASECLSKLVDWTDRGTCVLFGDGAGGVILSENGGEFILAETLHSDPNGVFAIKGGYSPVENAWVNNSEQHGTYLEMDGREVFNFAAKRVPQSIREVLAAANTDISAVKYFVTHQANYRITEAVAKKLSQPLTKFYTNIERYGNTSSASIPLALCDMEREGLITLGSGELLVLSGFGAGLTWGSILIKI